MANYPGAALSKTQVNSNLGPFGLNTPGDSIHLFGTLSSTATQRPATDNTIAGETPVAGQASIAICLAGRDNGGPPMVCFEGVFSAAPGAFEVDIQEADTDADAYYTTPSNPAYTITAVGANQQFRVDLSPTGGKFMRAKLVSRTNAVTLVLKATRLA